MPIDMSEEHIMRFHDMRDLRPQKRGWSPGGWFTICTVCNNGFCGSNTAAVCAPCVYDRDEKGIRNLTELESELVESFNIDRE